MTGFLLVHGAWHGAWCWDRVVPLLESEGHRAIALCLPGMGERAEELADDVDLSSHAKAVVDAFRDRKGDLIVVAHSYGGAVLQMACEDIGDQLTGCVYLDSSLLEHGEALMDRVADDHAQRLIFEARNRGGVPTLLPPAATSFGLTDPGDIAFAEARFTPQPLATYLERARLRRLPSDGPPSVYVTCTSPRYRPLASSRDRAIDHGWPQLEVEAGHDCMLSEPKLTVDVILRAAAVISSNAT